MNEMEPGEAIAIVGLAGRFPRSKNLDEFWCRLAAGEELVSFFTDEELLASGVPPELARDPQYVGARAILDDVELFDAAFFGLSPREAEIMDPQQRLFLECAWEALENAGYDPDRYAGPIGVYAGLSMNSYLFNNLLTNPDVLAAAGGYQIMLASDKDFVATRVSYKLNLRGPSLDIQTACSTSLVAVQIACQSLLNYQCDAALAGGVSVGSPQKTGYLYQPGMIMSPDGHCRAFDASGRGIIAGEGVGVVVLKRLSDAVVDGDTIHAIIRGSAINNDGADKVGYTAPSVNGQAEVIAMAQAMAGVNPESITYVEAHGTGTELGDPIEIAALTQAFRVGTDNTRYCAIGSVKTNMGHLDAAAGIAGLLKTVLALKHRQIPPSLHFERPNPNIDFTGSPFYVNTELKPWATNGGPRRAGVSSFGIGGTNAHVVVEEAPISPVSHPVRPSHLLTLSARTPSALEKATAELALHLRAHPELNLADVAYTLQTGRKAFGERLFVVVGSDPEEAAAALEGRGPRRLVTGSGAYRSRPVAFLFPGQGAQYVDMARDLYAAEPIFRTELDRCADGLWPHLGLDLRELLFPEPAQAEGAAELLRRTEFTQPALFAVEYALARLWMSWGMEPRAMLGHSIGEYVAACLADVFCLDDALSLVAARGRLMQELPGGSMLAVMQPEGEIRPELGGELSLAAVNAPTWCVVSGPDEQIEALRARLAARDVSCRPLHTSHAFHSSMMEPALEPFAERVRQLAPQPPTRPFLSNLTGTWITAEQATDPDYWAAHLRSTVRFADGVSELLRDRDLVLLEVGPGQTLSSLVKQHSDWTDDQPVIASLRHPHDIQPDHVALMDALGRLWLAGVAIDWSGVHAPDRRRRVPLPTYPFERQRYWVEPRVLPEAARAVSSGSTNTAAFPSRRSNLDEWFYLPSWRRFDLPHDVPGDGAALTGQTAKQILVFVDGCGLGEQLARKLTDQRHQVITVAAGDAFARVTAESYILPPGDRDGYERLFRELRRDGRTPDQIVHLWSVSPLEHGGLDPADLETAQDLGFYSLLYIAQSLGEPGMTAPIQLDIVTNGLFDVVGEEPLAPAKATMLGPCRVIPQEYSQITCRCIDVGLPAGGVDARVVAQVWKEFQTAPDQAVVAYRGAHRWIPSFEVTTMNAAPSQPPLLRERGVYLITGGMGGIGLALAEWLAQAVQARLVLTGRSAMPERGYWDAWVEEHGEEDSISRKIRRIQALEATGTEVLTVQADVTSPAEMGAAVALARARFGSINGVIHAAGVAGGGIIPLKTRSMAERVLAPKALGTIVLHTAVANEPLDFVVLCSSFNSVLGGAGQVDYCAANAFLDAFAHAKDRQGVRTIAINWSTWQEVGMAVDTAVPAHLQQLRDENLRHGMLTAEGQEAFCRVLAHPQPQVVVSSQDLSSLVQWYERLRVGDASSETARSGDMAQTAHADPPAVHARPDVRSAYVAPGTLVEEQIAEIWRTLLGIGQVGIDDDFFELGGHSLLATQLVTRVQRLFGVELSLRTIFEAPTIAHLAEQIETMLWVAESRPDDVLLDEADRDEVVL
ncbi:MAG: SDR family NAD(P)-dependent oxidoreductase [Chloroflexota bacterium]